MDSPKFKLRLLILYNIFQRKTLKKSFDDYENVCETIGKTKISHEDFEEKFRRYSRRHLKNVNGEDVYSYETNKKSINCSRESCHVLFEENSFSINSCILSDVLNKKSFDDSYEDLCNAFNDSFDRDTFEKRYDNYRVKVASKHLKFCDLPLFIVGYIVDNLDLKAQMILRKVSFGLRNLVDQRKPQYRIIHFLHFNERVWAEYRWNENEGQVVEYRRTGDNSQRHTIPKYVLDDDYKSVAFNDLAIALRNPKLHLEDLWFEFAEDSEDGGTCLEFTNRMRTLLSTIYHQISVETYNKNGSSDLNDDLLILSRLKPGTLESIRFYNSLERQQGNDNELMGTEQCKQAKDVIFDRLESIPIDDLHRFTNFEFRVKKFTIEELVKIRDVLSKSTSFKEGVIRRSIGIPVDDIIRELNLMRDEENSNIIYYPISDSEEILRFQLFPSVMNIQKKELSEVSPSDEFSGFYGDDDDDE